MKAKKKTENVKSKEAFWASRHRKRSYMFSSLEKPLRLKLFIFNAAKSSPNALDLLREQRIKDKEELK